MEDRLRRISFTTDIDSELVSNADIVVEAVFEDMAIKQETFALQTYCEDGDVPAAKDSCARLQRLYVERNRKLAASK